MFPFFLVSVGGDSAVQAPQIQMVDTTQQDTARYFGSQEEFADAFLKYLVGSDTIHSIIKVEDLKRDNLLRVAESEDGFVISLKDHIPYEFNGCVKPTALGNITLRSLERHLVGRDRSRDRDFISANLPDGCGHSNWDNKDIELPRFRFVNMPVLDVELSDLV